MTASEPLPHFVDDLLGYLHETHPTHATLDGVHTHDDLLEDLSRQGIEGETHALAGYLRRLDEIDPGSLTQSSVSSTGCSSSNIRGRMFELEEVRTWERNPQFYADILASSLAGQALFTHAPAAERARRVLSKLRQTPRLIQAARDNIKDPPGIFVKVGIETMRGALKFIDDDLPRAFSDVDDLHLLGDLADAQTEASQAVGAYLEYLETDLAPRARASFRLGREKFEQKLKLEEGIALPVDRLLAIATRELQATQEAFKSAAGKMNGGDPLAAWAQTKAESPGARRARRRSVASSSTSCATFLERQSIISLPAGEPITVAPTPDFYRWSFASMWTPGPFESKPTRAYYYLTDVDPSWPPDRQQEHLRDYNLPTLWSISIHEVYPGHFLHYQHLRRVESKARKSILFAPASFVEGWAHYCEQMMVEAGFGRDDPGVKLGQLAEALIRLVRFIVGIKLHAEDMSVEQGVRLFREEAFMEEASARREAERGTFDPTYLVYTAGKLMLLKLRQDYKQQQGKAYSAAAVPRHAARQRHGALLAASSADARRRQRRPARLVTRASHASLRIPMRRLRPPLRGDPEVLGCAARDMPEMRRPRSQADVGAGVSVQGHRLVRHRLTRKGQGARRRRFEPTAPRAKARRTPRKTARQRKARTKARRKAAKDNKQRRVVSEKRNEHVDRPRRPRRRRTPAADVCSCATSRFRIQSSSGNP